MTSLAHGPGISHGNLDYDIAIVGAGAAGLSAANLLSSRGLSVALIEARNRIGGRILTLRPPGSVIPVELEAQVQESYFHNWSQDPYSMGAYSYVKAGGLDQLSALAEPVADTLYFAGEATNTEGHTGTVHGALATGERAARLILG